MTGTANRGLALTHARLASRPPRPPRFILLSDRPHSLRAFFLSVGFPKIWFGVWGGCCLLRHTTCVKSDLFLPACYSSYKVILP